jgi:hypothetical protein
VWSLTRISFDIVQYYINLIYNFNGVHFCLIKFLYNYDIDYAIVNAIFKYNHDLSLRKLKQIVERDFLNRITPEKTFRYHLNKLLNYEYIYKLKQSWKQGQKLPLALTPRSRVQRLLQRMESRIFRYRSR